MHKTIKKYQGNGLINPKYLNSVWLGSILHKFVVLCHNDTTRIRTEKHTTDAHK